jgi:hypothetical protein
MRLPRFLRRRTEPLLLERIGARLTGAGICQHGHLLFAVRLLGHGLETGRDEQVDFVIARCDAADFVGTLLALIDTDGGDAGRAAFFEEVVLAEGKAAATIANRTAEHESDS